MYHFDARTTASHFGLPLFVALLVFALSSPTNADVTFVESRANLNANDMIDWGRAGTNFSQPSNPFVVNSEGGVRASVFKGTAGVFERRDQSTSFDTGWAGDFLPGEHLLFTYYTSGPIQISFNRPVSDAGAQIQRARFGDFTGRIVAFDSAGNALGTFFRNGTSGFTNNGSAIFLGVHSTMANIAAITLTTDSDVQIPGSVINAISFRAAAVPEPGLTLSFALIGAGANGCLLRRRRWRNQA